MATDKKLISGHHFLSHYLFSGDGDNAVHQ